MSGHYLDDIDWEDVAQKIAKSFVDKYNADNTFRVNDQTFLKMARLPKGDRDWVYDYSISTDQQTGE
jgi:hypothetical protein